MFEAWLNGWLYLQEGQPPYTNFKVGLTKEGSEY